MPAPANSVARCPRSTGAPERDRPFAVARGVHPPDRAGVRATVERLEVGDRLSSERAGRAADRRGGMQLGHDVEGRDGGVAQPPLEPRREMPHVRGGLEHGLSVPSQVPAETAERLGHGLHHDRVLLSVLGRRGECLGVRPILVGIAGTRGGAGERSRAHDGPATREQQLGARAHQDAAVDGGGEREAVGLHGAQAMDQPSRVERSAGIHTHGPGEHDLLELASGDPLDGGGDGPRVAGLRRLLGELHGSERLVGQGPRHPFRSEGRRGAAAFIRPVEQPCLSGLGAANHPIGREQRGRPGLERQRSHRDRGRRRPLGRGHATQDGEGLPGQRPEVGERTDLDAAGPDRARHAQSLTFEEAPASRLVGGQQVERRTKRRGKAPRRGACHPRVPTSSCVSPPESWRRSASGKPAARSIETISPGAGR